MEKQSFNGDAMTRGQRIGQLTKRELLQRLHDNNIEGSEHLRENSSSLYQLLGFCVYYSLVDEDEYNETLPSVETTLPCYLYTYIDDLSKRQRIDTYVQICTELYRRGSFIFNMAAMDACGSRTPFADDHRLPQRWRPRIDIRSLVDNPRSSRFITWLVEGLEDVRSSTLKHIFLPERWPSNMVPREPLVQGVIDDHHDTLPMLPQWMQLMSSTGWDNSINRMATKYFSNLSTRIKTHLLKETIDYFKLVRSHDAPQTSSVAVAIMGPLRPWIMHQDDWDVLLDIRKIFGINRVVTRGSKYSNELPEDVEITREIIALHLFLSKNGVQNHPFFPVASRSRKFSYIDKKIAGHLFTATDPNSSSEDSSHDGRTMSVGEMLGITEKLFNAKRKALRRQLRREFRKKNRRETDGKKKARLKKLEKRWSRLDCGKLPKGVRIDSVETDGVGLRMCLKTPVDRWDQYLQPVPEKPIEVPRAKRVKVDIPPPHVEVDEMYGCRVFPIVSACDTGRAKPFVASVSKDPTKKPESYVFTRSRYYHEMHYHQNRKWERNRMDQRQNVRETLDLLSNSGGIKNCDQHAWERFFVIERSHRDILRDEFVVDKERALWRMRMFRMKRASLDRAVHELLSMCTEGEPTDRPLVFGVGNASFKPCGRGELPVPTSALSVAFKRGIRKIQKKTGRPVIPLAPNEAYTTKCCCACGHETNPTMVWKRNKAGQRVYEWSGRLRTCNNCIMEGKVRDRDIQASRNILWLTMYMYYGLERPKYLCRPR